jgi:TFIIH basal transcription factor complex TTD-A subunit
MSLKRAAEEIAADFFGSLNDALLPEAAMVLVSLAIRVQFGRPGHDYELGTLLAITPLLFLLQPHLLHTLVLFIMVKAVRGRTCSLSTYCCSSQPLGTLVKCDASIKAMLVDIDDKNNNDFIIEDLDEEHLLVKETKVATLKARLNQVDFTAT